jgi:hypothetical protein
MFPRLRKALDALDYPKARDASQKIDLVLAIETFAIARGDDELQSACQEEVDCIRNSDPERKRAQTMLQQLSTAFEEAGAFSPGDEASKLFQRILDMVPAEATRRVLSGKGTPEDLEAARLYVEMLERSQTTAAADLRPVDEGAIVSVAEHSFSPRQATTARDFTVVVFRDRTADWIDEQGRLKARADKHVVIKTLMGDRRARGALNREQQEFTVRTTIPDQVYWRLVEKEAITAMRWEIADSEYEEINGSLEATFWAEVNPLLIDKMQREQD